MDFRLAFASFCVCLSGLDMTLLSGCSSLAVFEVSWLLAGLIAGRAVGIVRKNSCRENGLIRSGGD